MALTAEQIRASFEAKKKLLSGESGDTKGRGATRHRSKSDEVVAPSDNPGNSGASQLVSTAQNNLPADVQPESRTDTADSLRQENPARSGEARRSIKGSNPSVAAGNPTYEVQNTPSRDELPDEKGQTHAETVSSPGMQALREQPKGISDQRSIKHKISGPMEGQDSRPQRENPKAEQMREMSEHDVEAGSASPGLHKAAGGSVDVPSMPQRHSSQKSSTKNIGSKVPQALEIELAVLASLYQYPATCFPIFNERARPEFFFSPINRSFFERLSDYFTEHGQADPQAFLQFLTESGQLEKHGGSFFLSQLLSATSPPSALEYHLEILRDKFVQRSLYQAAAELARKAVAVPQEDDLFSLVSEHQAAIAELTTSLAARNGYLSCRRVSEIFAMTFDDSDNYFGDRVMAAGQPCTLLGPGDIGKSRLSLQLALSMITGRDFLGMPTHAANKTWLFIQSENSCRRLYADLKNMLAGLELAESERSQVEEHLFIHTLENDYDSFLSLEDDKIYAKVNDLIQKIKPDVIDWDPLNSLTDEDLNADVDMRKVCMKISHVTKQGDIARVPFVVHHALTGKTGAAKAVGWEKSSYGRNSKVLHAWTRAQINLAPRSPDDSTLLIMSCGKNNNGRAFPEVGVRFDEELGIYAIDQDFDPEAFREQVGIVATKRTLTAQMVRDFRWPAQLLDKKALYKAITDELGCGKSRAYELIDQAQKRGLISFNGITRLFSKKPTDDSSNS